MLDRATAIRFVEALVAVFVVAFAADPIFNGGMVDLVGPNALHSLVVAAVAAAVLAFRRALAAKS